MDMTTGLTYGKPERTPKAQAKPIARRVRVRPMSKKRRKETPVIKSVRAQVFERDEDCVMASVSPCEGPHEWCHDPEFMRSRTRNQAPEIRHQKMHSFRGCRKHHTQLDGRSRPRIGIMYLTAKCADGPLLCAEQLEDKAVR